MKKTLTKVAIYSGAIPSTTFIERLIKGLGKGKHRILIFGIRRKKYDSGDNIKVIDYGNSKFKKVLHYLKYLILLTVFKYKEKQKLDKWTRENNKELWTFKLKYYPVLYHRPDVFHIQWAKSLDDWMWVKEFNIKLVLSLRGAHINYSPIADTKLAKSYKKNFPKVDAFHAVSEAIKQEASIYGADPNINRVVYSGLDESYLNTPILPKNNKRLQILSVGRDHWKKGYNYSLDAMCQLKNNNLDFEYTIVGADTNIELLYHINDLKIDNNVNLRAALPFNDIIRLISNSDILLLPSVEEGIANVVLEAMAVGTIVISTNCGGMGEVIKDGINGFLVPVRDSDALAEKIKFVSMLDDGQKSQVIRAARNSIKKNHTIKNMVNGMTRLYDQFSIQNSVG